MKALCVFLFLFASFSTFAADQDFFCESLPNTDKIEVRFVDGILSYDNGRIIEVAVASKSTNGNIMKVSGLSKGLVFAGGGRQSVSVSVDMKTKKGSVTIHTKTFYRTSEVTQELICTL
jgi:hypothetical protein